MENLNISNLKKSSEMLNEEIFWKIVSTSLENSNNVDEQEEILINEISKLSPKEIIGFRLRTDKLLMDTYSSEMWCAGSILKGGCSDDGFEYFRNWVISRGKEAYYNAKENPDSLINERLKNPIDHHFETFWYVAFRAFERRTGEKVDDYIDFKKFHKREGSYPKFEFNWYEEQPETMKAICPRLFNKLWN